MGFGEKNNLRRCLRPDVKDPVFAYIAVSLCALLFLMLCIYCTHGEGISRYFWEDTLDTGGDFFNSIQYVKGEQPYAKFTTLYPPLANFLFLLIYRMIPVELSAQWPDDFWAIMAARGTEVDLRMYQAPLLLFMMFVLLCCWMFAAIVTSICSQQSPARRNLLAFCMLFSPGMLYALERGNILLLVVPLVLFFVYYRNSDNALVRELALIALAVAAGLKLYPAFFGVLLLKDRQYKVALRTVIYGIVLFLLPCLAFQEGFSFLSVWLEVLTREPTRSDAAAMFLGVSFDNIVESASYYCAKITGIRIPTSWAGYAGFVVSAVLLVEALLCKKNWQSVLYVTTAVIMFHFQGTYVFSLFVIPVIAFILEEKRLTKENIVPFALMVLLMIHLPFSCVIPLYYLDTRIRHFVSLVLLCWCLLQFIPYLRKRK